MDPVVDPTPPVVDDVVEPVVEPAVDPVTPSQPATPANTESDDTPEWAKGLVTRVDELAAQVAALTPIPDTPLTPADESPVKGPWTNRSLFSHKG